MSWGRGYFTESAYSYGYYPETSPARLRWAAMLKGIRVPADGFRYLDLGCGQGLNTLVMAANHPDSEFVGIDFMPEHVAHARRLAEAAGLSNVTFFEADFVALAQEHAHLGVFDLVVAHGITTWVAPDVREALFQLVALVLKPGGLMFNSYNTYPGWLTASPFQHMVLQLQRRHGGYQALHLAQRHLTELKDNGGALYKLVPLLEGRLERMQQQDDAYLVQEYNNLHWQPVYCSQMLELAGTHKLTYVASASLPENFDSTYPSKLREQINAEPDLLIKETLRDLALCQSFRRDIYAKGVRIAWKKEWRDMLLNQRFLVTRLVAEPAEGAHFDIRAGTLSFQGRREICLEVMRVFGSSGSSLRAVHEALPEISFATLLELITMLLHGGWLALDAQTGSDSACRLNQALGRACLSGAPYGYVVLGRVKAAVPVTDTDLMMIGLIANGTAAAELGEKLTAAMQQLNKHFMHDGKALADARLASDYAEACARRFLTEMQPNLVRLGAF